MKIGANGTIGAGDQVRIEALQEELSRLRDCSLVLYQYINGVAASEIERMRESVERGANAFASDKPGRMGELKRELSLLRCEYRSAKWTQVVAEMRSKTDALSAAVAELEAADSLSGLLGVCN